MLVYTHTIDNPQFYITGFTFTWNNGDAQIQGLSYLYGQSTTRTNQDLIWILTNNRTGAKITVIASNTNPSQGSQFYIYRYYKYQLFTSGGDSLSVRNGDEILVSNKGTSGVTFAHLSVEIEYQDATTPIINFNSYNNNQIYTKSDRNMIEYRYNYKGTGAKLFNFDWVGQDLPTSPQLVANNTMAKLEWVLGGCFIHDFRGSILYRNGLQQNFSLVLTDSYPVDGYIKDSIQLVQSQTPPLKLVQIIKGPGNYTGITANNNNPLYFYASSSNASLNYDPKSSGNFNKDANFNEIGLPIYDQIVSFWIEIYFVYTQPVSFFRL